MSHDLEEMDVEHGGTAGMTPAVLAMDTAFEKRYRSVDSLLNTHFLLLRADCTTQLRLAIAAYRKRLAEAGGVAAMRAVDMCMTGGQATTRRSDDRGNDAKDFQKSPPRASLSWKSLSEAEAKRARRSAITLSKEMQRPGGASSRGAIEQAETGLEQLDRGVQFAVAQTVAARGSERTSIYTDVKVVDLESRPNGLCCEPKGGFELAVYPARSCKPS